MDSTTTGQPCVWILSRGGVSCPVSAAWHSSVAAHWSKYHCYKQALSWYDLICLKAIFNLNKTNEQFIHESGIHLVCRKHSTSHMLHHSPYHLILWVWTACITWLEYSDHSARVRAPHRWVWCRWIVGRCLHTEHGVHSHPRPVSKQSKQLLSLIDCDWLLFSIVLLYMCWFIMINQLECFYGIQGHVARDRNPGLGYNTLLLQLIQGRSFKVWVLTVDN